MEAELDSCLICTSQCQSSQTLTNGTVKRESVETGDVQFTRADQVDDHPELVSDGEHLMPYFVLKNILKVPTESLEQLIYEEYSNHDPLSQGNNGGQVPLCPPCAELARQFRETFEEVSRLKMILSGIQAEFMDKLQRNKDEQCQDSSSIWSQVRRQVVLHCFGDDPPNTQESCDFEEEWHFGDTMKKSEVVDKSDDDDGSFAIPTFPVISYSSSAFHANSTSTLDTDDGVNENLSPITLPPKKRKVSHPVVTPVLENLSIGNEILNPPPNIEGSDDFEEEWHFGDTMIKAEVENEPGEGDDDEGNSGVPAFAMSSYSSSALSFEARPISHLEGMKENLSSGSRSPPPPKKQKAHTSQLVSVLKVKGKGEKYKREWFKCLKCPFHTQKASLMDAHVPLHEKGTQVVICKDCGHYLAPEKVARHRAILHPPPKSIQKITKKTAQPQPAPVLQCMFCPHKTTVINTSKRHQKLHEEGSEATACNECGTFVFPKGLIAHHVVCVSAIRNSLGRDELLSDAGSKEKKRNMNTSNPGFISFNRASYKRKVYQCCQCPYETLAFARIKIHVDLHDEASQSVTCEECGFFLPPDQLETHRAVNHSEANLAIAPPTTVKLKCVECSYECKSKLKTLFETHVKGHRQDAGAVSKCEDCGCHLSLRLLKGHRKYCLARRIQSCEESGVTVGDPSARPYEPESEANDDQDGVGEQDFKIVNETGKGAFGGQLNPSSSGALNPE